MKSPQISPHCHVCEMWRVSPTYEFLPPIWRVWNCRYWGQKNLICIFNLLCLYRSLRHLSSDKPHYGRVNLFSLFMRNKKNVLKFIFSGEQTLWKDHVLSFVITLNLHILMASDLELNLFNLESSSYVPSCRSHDEESETEMSLCRWWSALLWGTGFQFSINKLTWLL